MAGLSDNMEALKRNFLFLERVAFDDEYAVREGLQVWCERGIETRNACRSPLSSAHPLRYSSGEVSARLKYPRRLKKPRNRTIENFQ